MLQPFNGFVGPAYQSQSIIADGERLINLYPEQIEAQAGQVPWALYPTPGVSNALTSAPVVGTFSGRIRAMANQRYTGLMAFIAGTQLFTSDGTMPGTTIKSVTGASIVDDGNPAQIVTAPTSGNILFASGGEAQYVISGGTVVTNATTATHVNYQSGFFLALDSTGLFQISALNDMTSWDPTQTVKRSQYVDPWIAMAVVHQDIWLFGRETADIFYNAGTAPFPFQARPGATIGAGCLAIYSLAALDNTLFWLGSTASGGAIVYRANGLIPQRVSTHAIEAAIASYTTVTDAVGWAYTQEGHAFYVLTFPSADVTWVYDAATDMWHQRGWWDAKTPPAQYHAYRPQWQASLGGTTYVGDRAIGAIYQLNPNSAAEVDGSGIRRLRRFPHMSQARDRVFFNRLELLVDAGLGLNTGQGTDPQLMLRWSNDGGNTWGPELWRSAGPQGQYAQRVFWAPLGSARDRVFQLVQSDPTPSRWLGAYLDTGVARA